MFVLLSACTKNDVHEDKWEWLSKEKIPLSNLYWKMFESHKAPYDTNGDAKFLSLYKKGTTPQFDNWAESHSYKYICQKMLSVASKDLKVLLKNITGTHHSVRISMLIPMMCHLMTLEKFLARARGPELKKWAPEGDLPKKIPSSY